MLLDTYGIQEGPDQVSGGVLKFLSFSENLRSDPDFRHQADSDPHAALARYDIEYPETVDIRIIENTDEVFHLVLPPDPNQALMDEDLLVVAGGKSASSAGTASTASSVAGTLSSASSAGSGGSAD